MSSGIKAGFSQLMANTGASDGNQSQDGDRGLQAILRSINKQQQSIQNLTRQLETIQPQLQVLLRINEQERRNDNEEQDEGIGPARPTFNHIPKIQNQRRSTVGFDDTLDEDVDFGEFANPRSRQKEGRQWQPNYKGDNEYKLKVNIPNFSGDLDIEGVFDWLTKVDKFFEYTKFPDDIKVKFVAYKLKGRASLWWDRLREMRMREG